MYVEVQKRQNAKLYYLVESVKHKGKTTKIRIYLGKNLAKGELEKLKKQKSKALAEKSMKVRAKSDPLESLVSSEMHKLLEEAKKKHKKSPIHTDRNLWKNYYETFVSEFTYNTNAIEGSTLTLQETSMILFDKIVPEGKTITEISEAQNHKDAFDTILAHKKSFTKSFVLKLHHELMHNILWKYAGKFRDVPVGIRGSDVVLTPPDKVEEEFRALMRWYATNKNKYHPVVVAAYFHFAFELIHPFRDGNGRVGRLIMNWMLHNFGYPMINIKFRNRQRYYNALHAMQNNEDLKPLVDLIAGYILEDNPVKI